jgi:acetate kinase
MADALLILNAGSSSLKFSVFVDAAPPVLLLQGELDGIITDTRFRVWDAAQVRLGEQTFGHALGHAGAIEFLFAWSKSGPLGQHRIVAAGHRVVHGGPRFTAPARVTRETLAALQQLAPLAPLHLPQNLRLMETIAELEPTLPQVACFDTAFHQTQPPLAQAFALPPEITDLGVRRYGFHGLSYEYIASVLPKFDPAAAAGRTIIAHLGNGSSMCAVRGGRSVASTMGFSTIDGLVMGTRCGLLDPGVLLFLMDKRGMDARALEKLMYHESGLLGVSGISSDMRTLAESRDPRARTAIDLFIYRISRELGSLAAALGGLDALVFTAGMGENAAWLRERICRDAAWLGVEVDARANEAGGPRISPPDSRVSAWVIPTNEALMIALHTQRALASATA